MAKQLLSSQEELLLDYEDYLRHRRLAMWAADSAEAMAVRDVVATIFQPGMSTADQADQHAGRGVGLDVLHALVRETGARIKLISTPSSFTRFILQWSPAT